MIEVTYGVAIFEAGKLYDIYGDGYSSIEAAQERVKCLRVEYPKEDFRAFRETIEYLED